MRHWQPVMAGVPAGRGRSAQYKSVAWTHPPGGEPDEPRPPFWEQSAGWPHAQAQPRASTTGRTSSNSSGLLALTDQRLSNPALHQIAFHDPSNQSTSGLISLENRNVRLRLAIYPTSNP